VKYAERAVIMSLGGLLGVQAARYWSLETADTLALLVATASFAAYLFLRYRLGPYHD
jgi:hypothetical protein